MQLTLVTIPISHFCEKARWALDLAHLSYVEHGSLPLVHWTKTRPLGGRSAPLLVTPEGVLTDSTDILRWVDRRHAIYPIDAAERSEALALEDHFDRVLGPHARRIGYAYVLPHERVALQIVGQRTASWQVRLARPIFPILAAILMRALKITPAGVERSLTVVREVFAEVDRRLSDGRVYLVGDRFSAADLTFAALSGPLLVPPEHPIQWPPEAAWPTDLRTLRAELVATRAGQHVLRMYREHRVAPIPGRSG